MRHTLAGLRRAVRARVAVRMRSLFANPNSEGPSARGRLGACASRLSAGVSIRACAPLPGGQIPEGLAGLEGGGVINYSTLGLKPPTPAAVGVDVLRILFAHSVNDLFSLKKEWAWQIFEEGVGGEGRRES